MPKGKLNGVRTRLHSMSVPDKVTVTNVRTKSLEQVTYARCPYCRSKKEESQLSDHVEKTCPFSPARLGRYIAEAMTAKGFRALSTGALVIGNYYSLSKTVLIRISKTDEFNSYATEHLQGFFVNWDVCIGRIHLLVDDWRRDLIDNEEYAERTLTGFGWSSDLPTANRHTALLAALGVFSEERIDKVLSMLYDYWKVKHGRVDDSIVVGSDIEWFRHNCVLPDSQFQKERSKLRSFLLSDAMQSSQSTPELANILTLGRLTPSIDNFYVVRPSGQAPLL